MLVGRPRRDAGFHAGTGLGVWLVLLCICSCDFPFSSSKYTTTDDAQPAESNADIRAPIVQAFAGTDSACARDLEDNCASNLDRCSATPGCSDFAVCVLDEATPAAETTCGDLLTTSLDARWSFENLRACWAERYQQCSVGSDWSCVDRYNAPSTERSELTVSQTLQYLDQPGRRADFSVRICGQLTDCKTPIAETTTDDDGRYTVTFPVGTAPGRPGSSWLGYRKVDSPGIYPTRIETNLPVWGNRVEVTRLLDSSQVDLLRTLSGAVRDEAVFVQVLDCLSSPAARVRLVLHQSKTGLVGYVGSSEASTGARGAAAVYNLELGQEQLLTAEVDTDDSEHPVVIGRWHGFLESGEVVYLKMYPEPR